MRSAMPKRSSALYWLENLVVTGREEEDPYERDAQGNTIEEDGEKKLKEGWEYDDDDKPVKIDDEGDLGDEGDDDGRDVPDDQKTPEQLRKKIADQEETLRKERVARRKAEREARKAGRKKVTEPKKKQEDEEAERKLAESQTRIEKLATGLLNSRLDQVVLEEARKQGFIDPTDALIDSVRGDIDYDQDEDDPSDIDIDLDSVKDAVADLANRKKHLVGSGTPGEPSGSRQRRRRKTGDDEATSEQALQGHYAALR